MFSERRRSLLPRSSFSSSRIPVSALHLCIDLRTCLQTQLLCCRKAQVMESVSTVYPTSQSIYSPHFSSYRYGRTALQPVLIPENFHIGIGLFFSAFMIVLTAIQARYTGFSPKNSEEFNSASRSVKPGLIASGIVSAWTWAATLVCILPCGFQCVDSFYGVQLQSSAVAYKYGISGPWWYGAGATVQVLLFAQARNYGFK